MQNYKTLRAPPDTGSRPSIDVHPYFPLLILRKALTELRDKVSDVCDRELTKISELGEYKNTDTQDCWLSSPPQLTTALNYISCWCTNGCWQQTPLCLQLMSTISQLKTRRVVCWTLKQVRTLTSLPASESESSNHVNPPMFTGVLKCIWRNSNLWPFPAHTHLQQTEPRTRGGFLQCEFWFSRHWLSCTG